MAARQAAKRTATMAAGLLALCLACLFGATAAAAQDGRCRASPDYACLIASALAIGEAGDTKNALEVAGKLEDAFRKARALEEIAVRQAGAGNTKGALATAERLERASQRNAAFHGIAAAQAEAGDPGSALATAARIEAPGWKAQALLKIAAAQVGAGDAKGALKTVEAAPATAGKTAYAAMAAVLADIAASLARRR